MCVPWLQHHHVCISVLSLVLLFFFCCFCVYFFFFNFFFFQAEDGIRDLVRSRGLGDVYKRQFYYYPRVDHDFLAAHSQGIIATSGCMSAEVPRAIRDQGVEGARKKLDWHYDCLLYTSDAADERSRVNLGGSRTIKKKKRL